MDPMNLQQNNVVHVNDFINLIRGENEDPIYNFGSDLLNDCFIDKQFVSLAGNSIFDQNNNVVNAYDPNSTLSSFSYFGGKVKGEGEGEDENDGIYSSSKTTTTTIIAGESTKAKSRMKTDRSKTLITERRRRGQMKEKLYSLRSLVPNITKMDKASIIGDAVEYVHRLQAQANKLKAEIAGLETSTLVYESYQGSSSIIDDPLNILVTNNSHPISKMIMQIKMYQVEEKGYHGKIACNKGQGVAASLYKALESLAGFKVQNSNLVTVCDSLILTFTLNAEIAGLETSTLVYESYQGSSSIIDDPLNILVTNNSHPISKMIMQIKMYQVEEKGYHGKIACNKGQGVAASLYKALESLAGFKVQNSNLVTVCDSLILTFTLNVKGCDPEINLPNLKLWVTGALLNQGFEFMAFAHDA
ncbi:hypothetical protein TanjilG_30182 [Lupinus angustifolius]|uniref:BHLH domain-containing protein n=1 Tax=Lupinus angustifolius TaxID=3871 RepID=A0A4P1R6S8_LUPAN|nr:hypothetical protein TanjilG_30182 [Lupinus angustifolius]